MLVCNVSLRPKGRIITAALLEAGAADDASTTGNVVFATLIDDPASVADIVDAYLGEIMVEAAAATDAVSVGSVYGADVVEAGTAQDSISATVPVGTWHTTYARTFTADN